MLELDVIIIYIKSISSQTLSTASVLQFYWVKQSTVIYLLLTELNNLLA